MPPSDTRKDLSTALLATAGAGLCYLIFRKRAQILQRLRYACDFRNPLRHKSVEIVENTDDCQRIVSRLKKHCDEYKVLGFDCEWVTVGGTRRPIALLQLASHRGLCALIRLCSMKTIPKSLRELLEDDGVLKVGVAPAEDASRLAHDYGVGVASTLDLRFIAMQTNRKPEGLAKLSKSVLNVQLDKNWRVQCSDWEAGTLSEKQVDYAAKDALVAVEIFKILSKDIRPRRLWNSSSWSDVYETCEPFIDVRFKDGTFSAITRGVPGIQKTKKLEQRKQISRGISTRSKALYDNCLMEAPDGELLCTCDRRKAQWYIDQNLGQMVKEEPFTVRLNFEPAGRAVGEVGRYCTIAKENQCVVCGRQDAYIRKNVVPREYRKHFPVVMKSHTSHDVLLLCPQCHQLSNISDLKVRKRLAKLCDAPYMHEEGGAKFVEDPRLKQLRSAARALLRNADKIPEDRKKVLTAIVLEHYPEVEELTEEILQEAAFVETLQSVPGHCPHGEKVVTEFQNRLGGLIELERIWREHFLQTMHPRFLPELWSTTHNANRLEIRATEGRIEKEDLVIAGLPTAPETETNVVTN